MTQVHFTPPPGWVKARAYHLLAPLVMLLLLIPFEKTWLGQQLELQMVNLRFRVRSYFDPPADPRLVFVAIDEFSLAHLHRWPWPRAVEADFLKSIANAGLNPRVVSFDLMFTEPTGESDQDKITAGQDNDSLLGEAVGLFPTITGALSLPKAKDLQVQTAEEKRTQDELAEGGPTVPIQNIRGDINQVTGSDVAIFPILPLRKQSLFGFVNDDPSPIDDIRHTLPFVLRVKDKLFASLALQTLCQTLAVDPDKIEVDLIKHTVVLKDLSGKIWTVPINAHGEFSINYRSELGFHTVSFAGLTQNLTDHAQNGSAIAPDCNVDQKTLLIGEDATALADMGPSPLNARSPLPLAHLNVINNVLKNDYITFVPWYWVVFGWAMVTWPTLIRLKEAPLGEAVLVPIAIEALYIIGAFALFGLWSIEIALAWPVLSYAVLNFGGVILRWREERHGREQLKQIFSQMVSPEIMNHILDQPENMKLGGLDRASTVLFSDIRDYTKFSEGLEAEQVMQQLNVYFDRMVPCVKECNGTFHKFIGDAIMAAWGDLAPLSAGPEKDAQNAVRSALMMRRRLAALNAERKEMDLVPLRIGIGLNHGVVQAGMLGSSDRKEFTVMGDGVNTASRLEGLTKEFKTDLAISESVKQLVGEGFLVRRLGLIVLKGKTEPTVVYEVLAEKGDMEGSRMSEGGVARYERAFDCFLARKFAEAEAGFLECQKDYPDDHCVKSYLKASREYLAHPPGPEWDGRIIMETK